MKQFFPMQWRPTCGCELVYNRHFPDDTQGDYLLNNDIGFQGILRYRVKEDGSGFFGHAGRAAAQVVGPELPPGRASVRARRSTLRRRLVQPLGRPHAALAARPEPRPHPRPDLADHVSRRPLLEPPKIAGATVPELLDLLKVYEDRVRYRARRELRERPEQEVLKALERGSPASTRAIRNTGGRCSRRSGCTRASTRSTRSFLKQMLTCPEPQGPRRGNPRAVLLARPHRRAARAPAQAGQRRAPSRSARSRSAP